MMRIRIGAGWPHDPDLRAALRGGKGPARAAAARAVVDALALEVDGVDVAAGRAEGPLLPTLEALLHAIARIVGGASHATVAFPEGEVELLMRRRGRAALLTVVALSRPSRVISRDVEVEVDALASAALEASAALCRDLAELLPGAESREARPLRAAARTLRRTEEGAPHGPSAALDPAQPGPAKGETSLTCALELGDDDGLLAAYEGGRPDLGSLLIPGRLVLRRSDGRELWTVTGIPFLVVRDLGPAADAVLRALCRREPRCDIALGRWGRAPPLSIAVDLAGRTVSFGSAAAIPCPPLELALAFSEAQAELGRVVRCRNPRQAENAYVAELERAAAERLARIEELAEGDRPAAAPGGGRPPSSSAVPQRPLGPGRLRRVAFRPTFRFDAGAPAGAGLVLAGGVAIVAGRAAVAGIERASGSTLWRADGCIFAGAAGGIVLLARGDTLTALNARSGKVRWSRPLPGAPPGAIGALARGPLFLIEPGAATGLDPGSGRTLWRLEPPGAARLAAADLGGVLVVGADTGVLYGVDAAGRLLWRLRASGPVVGTPVAAAGLCLAIIAVDAATALIAVDPTTGARRWEAPLDLAPGVAPCAWGRRIAIAGSFGGDPLVTALERTGATAWSVAPALEGPITAAAAGPLLVVRADSGALVALGRDGIPRWSRPAPAGEPLSRGPPPVIARAMVITAAGDGIQALDAHTGEIVGAIAGAAPVRLAADASLRVAAMDADGLAAGWRLATHLSVV